MQIVQDYKMLWVQRRCAMETSVNSRGISDIESSTVTSEFGGKFKDPQEESFWIILN
jgi:GTP cyclohydrolase I